MPSFPVVSRRLRTCLFIFFCVCFLGFTSLWAVTQRAKTRSESPAPLTVPTSLFLPDKRGVTPQANTIVVNSLSDVANGSDGLCTLREAITAANNNAASGVTAGECAAGTNGVDTIDMTGLTAAITLTSALPDITSNMEIKGPGPAALKIQRSTAAGTPGFRIFTASSNTVKISGLTVFGGSFGLAAGIYNTGTLTLTNMTVSGNQTDGGGSGGGIGSNGTLNVTSSTVSNNTSGDGIGAGIYITGGMATVINSTVSGNTANGTAGGGITMTVGGSTLTLKNSTVSGNSGRGIGAVSGTTLLIADSTISNNSNGGIDVFSAQLTVTNSTISGNTAVSGGGIMNFGTTTLINSTVSGNTATVGFGGGIYNATGLNLINCTIAGNSAGNTGGGIWAQGPRNRPKAVTNLKNTIIANNTAGAGTGFDLAGTDAVTSQDYNFIGNDAGASIAGITTHNIMNVDPMLGPLANNGGPTKTHALLSNSLALDAADNCVTQATHCGDSNIPQLTTDQRGVSRLVDGPDADTIATVDIGAYETQGPLSDLPDTSTNEDTQLLVGFDPGDTSTITSVTATSSNSTVVPNDSAHLSAAIVGTTGIVTLNPAADLFGAANITITVNRNGGSESKTILLTVNSVNDPPSFTASNQVVNEDSGPQMVINWVTNVSPGPSDESNQTVNIQITGNTNPALFAVAPTLDAGGTLSYTLAPNANGSANMTVTATDNGGTANGGIDTSTQIFNLAVNPVNDAPSFVKGPDITVNEDFGLPQFSGWATSLSAGPSNESSQTLTFQVTTNTNPSLFQIQPAISSNGTLSFAGANNANGSAMITIVLRDNGGTANGGVDTSAAQTFIITVTPVNDAPSFTKGANQTVLNTVPAQTVNNWATNISPGPADESSQTVTFQVVADSNAALFSVTPAISSTGTLTYTPNPNTAGTATITINLKDSGGTANGGSDTSASQSFTITINPAGGFISFVSSSSNTTENSGSTTITVSRTGNTTLPVTVDYATNPDDGVPCSIVSGTATPKCDFTAAFGTLKFGIGETSKTITILISQDSFVEGSETMTLTLSNQTGGAALGSPSTTSIHIVDDVTEPPTNVIDDPNIFVRMHYHDFLNREADQSGLNFWTGQMTNCGAADLTVCRVNVSASFFVSIEFQQTGYLVERFYKSAYGDATGTSTTGGSHQLAVPVVRFNEFLKDTQRIGQGVVVLQPGWEQALENNKQAYASEFVQTARFITAFPTTMTPAQFVDQLNQNAGNVLSASERTTAINLFSGAADSSNTTARAKAARQVAENPDLYNAEFNRAFVLTQYIGYLRRNPNDAPDTDYTGYEFWLNKLNQFNGDYIAAEMVKAFISSNEYRGRFGP